MCHVRQCMDETDLTLRSKMYPVRALEAEWWELVAALGKRQKSRGWLVSGVPPSKATTSAQELVVPWCFAHGQEQHYRCPAGISTTQTCAYRFSRRRFRLDQWRKACCDPCRRLIVLIWLVAALILSTVKLADHVVFRSQLPP